MQWGKATSNITINLPCAYSNFAVAVATGADLSYKYHFNLKVSLTQCTICSRGFDGGTGSIDIAFFISLGC